MKSTFFYIFTLLNHIPIIMKTTGIIIRFFAGLMALSYTGVAANAQSFETEQVTREITTKLNKDGSEKLELYVSVDWPASSYNAVITEKMQKAIIYNMSSMLDSWGVSASQITTSNLTQAIYIYNELLVENFKDWLGDGANGAEISLTGSFSHYHKNFACCQFVLWYYVNHCAHPNIYEQYLVLDTKTGDIVTVNDLFIPGYRTALENILNQQKIYISIDDIELEKEHDDRTRYAISDKFYLDGQGITFIYDYEPYGFGTYIPVPWHKISHILK